MNYFLLFAAQGASEENRELLSLLTNFRNPIYFSIILMLVLVAILYITMRSSYLPRHKKILTEKTIAESKNVRLMAIFSELDPNPILRIDITGKIIFANPAAKEKKLENLIDKPITELLPGIVINPAEFIFNNKEASFSINYSDSYYSVFIKGISYLHVAQVYFHDITELKLNERELKRTQKELKSFSRYLQVQIEEERKRISRELHDDIGQKMVFLKLNLQKDLHEITFCDDSQAYVRNARIIENISRDIKTIAYSLRPHNLEEIGLYSSLIKLIETVEMQSSIKGKLKFIDVEEKMEINFEISIYRIIQEAISNIVKYSKAKEFTIQLMKRAKILQLIISDNGIGFDLEKNAQSKGMGLRNMKERAEFHRGIFKINSAPDAGTIIMINFPFGG